MAISSELLMILVCPENHRPLRLADASEIATLNNKIQAGMISNRLGKRITQLIEGALLRDDNKVAYPICESIPILLIDEALIISEL